MAERDKGIGGISMEEEMRTICRVDTSARSDEPSSRYPILVAAFALALCASCGDSARDQIEKDIGSCVAPLIDRPDEPRDEDAGIPAPTLALYRTLEQLGFQVPLADRPFVESQARTALEELPRRSTAFEATYPREALERFPAEESASLAKELGLRLDAFSLEYADAKASAHLAKHLQVESRLMVLHQNLAALLPEAALGSEPLALLTDDALRAGVDSTAQEIEAGQRKNALFHSPILEEHINTLVARKDRYARLLSSPGRSEARAGLLRSFERVPESAWKDAMAGCESRERKVYDDLVEREAIHRPELRSLLSSERKVEPPDGFSRAVMSAWLDARTNPTQSTLDAARLVQLRRLSDIDPSVAAKIGLERDTLGTMERTVARFLDDRVLAELRVKLDALVHLHQQVPPESHDIKYVADLSRCLEAVVAEQGERTGKQRPRLRFGELPGIGEELQNAFSAGELGSQAEKNAFLGLLELRMERGMWPKRCTELATKILAQKMTAEAKRIGEILTSLRGLGEKVSRGAGRLDPAQEEGFRTRQRDLNRIAEEHARTLAACEKRLDARLVGDGDRKAVNLARWFGLGGGEPDGGGGLVDPEPPSPIGLGPRPWKPGPGDGEGALVSGSVSFLGSEDSPLSVAHCEREVEALERSVGSVDPQPALRGGDAGRRVASVSDLEDGPAAFARIVQDEKETRLPKELHTWDGLRNENNELFRFEDVRSLKSFRSLGGGIHMGNKASVETGSLAGASRMLLTYDVGRGVLLLRDIVDGRTLPVLEITPEELKALHGFAATERNLAVTIGWTGGSAPRDISSGSTVLLDRYFVDTLVGQNLVVADKLPWSLDKERLPNGAPNPVQEAFSKALADSLGDLRRTIGDACRQALKDERDTKAWAEVLGSGLRVIEVSMQELVDMPISGEIPEAWSATFTQAQSDWLLLSMALASVTSSDATSFLAQVKEIEGPDLNSLYFKTDVIRLQIHELASDLAGELESNSKGDTTTPAQLYSSVLLPFLRSSTVPRVAFDLWCSQTHADLSAGMSGTERAEELVEYLANEILNPTTLAVLIDEETSLKLTPERAVLQGGMRYAYLTGWFEVSSTRVGRSQDSKDEERETRELKPLTQAANSRIEELARAYPALERVRTYARVVALLRMAMTGQQLAGVDLTALAGVEAISQERFPTPDAVKN